MDNSLWMQESQSFQHSAAHTGHLFLCQTRERNKQITHLSDTSIVYTLQPTSNKSLKPGLAKWKLGLPSHPRASTILAARSRGRPLPWLTNPIMSPRVERRKSFSCPTDKNSGERQRDRGREITCEKSHHT